MNLRRWLRIPVAVLLVAALLVARAAVAAPAVPDPVRALAPAIDALGLPLTLIWPEGKTKAVLVFLSGDGGWQRLDDAVAQALRAHGVATVGWSSFTYFLKRKSPEQVATDLGRLVDVLARVDRPLYLGGYSFGSEIVPAALVDWPATRRRRVRGLALLAPSASASYQVDPMDWVRPPVVDPAHRVDDAVRRLGGLPILCLAPQTDDDCACAALAALPGVTTVILPGDHHFDYDGEALATAIRERLFARGDRAD